MSQNQPPELSFAEPEKTFIPVRAKCGHSFPIPLVRLADGREFCCPVCGEADRIDQAAVEAAREELEALRTKGPLDAIGTLVSKHLPSLPDEEKNETRQDS